MYLFFRYQNWWTTLGFVTLVTIMITACDTSGEEGPSNPEIEQEIEEQAMDSIPDVY